MFTRYSLGITLVEFKCSSQHSTANSLHSRHMLKKRSLEKSILTMAELVSEV